MSDDMRSRVVVADVVADWLVPKPTTTSILNVVHILIGMFRINRKSLFRKKLQAIVDVPV